MTPLFARIAIPVVALLCCAGSRLRRPALVIEGTRIVFPSSAKDVTVGVVNPDANAYLMQAWRDTIPDAQSKPEAAKVPFMLTPAVSRIDAGDGRSVRIVGLPADLPQDCESLCPQLSISAASSCSA